MAILQVITTLEAGGAEKLVSEFFLHQKKNMDILILSHSLGKYGGQLESFGVKVIKPNSSRHYFHPLNLIFLLKNAKNYDTIHFHLFNCLYWGAILSLFLKKKRLIYTEHSTFNKRRRYPLFRLIERWIYSRYSYIVGVSDFASEQLKNWLKVDWDKIKVIKNGIHLDSYIHAIPYSKQELKCSSVDVLMTMVARFSVAKDQKTLIKVMKELPSNYKLLLVGEGELKNANEDLVKELNISDRVLFLGYRNDIPRILKSVDICILSSHWEGLPLSAVESMASGKPLIASNVIGIKEIVEGAGVLFEHENTKDLKNQITRLLENKEFYDKVGQNCQERAKSFDINETIKEYNALYETLP